MAHFTGMVSVITTYTIDAVNRKATAITLNWNGVGFWGGDNKFGTHDGPLRGIKYKLLVTIAPVTRPYFNARIKINYQKKHELIGDMLDGILAELCCLLSISGRYYFYAIFGARSS
jgi:hypothetical protein